MGIIELRKKAGGGKMKRYFKGGLVVFIFVICFIGYSYDSHYNPGAVLRKACQLCGYRAGRLAKAG